MLTSAILKAYKNTNAHFYPWTSMVMIMLIKTHYQLKDSCKTMHWGKRTLVFESSHSVYVGVWVCLVTPSVHSSITLQKQVCTLMKPQGQTHTHTNTHTHTHTHTHAHTRTHTHTLFEPPVLYPWWTATSSPLKNSAANTQMRIKLFFSSVIEADQRHAWSVPG